jgi:hypothetical protein
MVVSRSRGLWLTVLLLEICTVAAFSQPTPHTPKPGSPERQAICDGARDWVIKKYATQTLPGPIVFHIDHIAVQDGYCFFDATPRFKDGSFVPPQYLPDIAFNVCLKGSAARHWTVIADLSRSDVPTAAEVQAIKQKLPADFPMTVFSPDWRNLLTGQSRE